MACPVCGNASACLHERARTTILIDPEVSDDSEQQFARSLDRAAALPMAANAGHQPQTAYNDDYWRQEVASRVQQHRARRRRRVDPNATMELDFAAEAVYAVPEAEQELPVFQPPVEQPATVQQAVAAPPLAQPVPSMPGPDDPRPEPYKVIQFPRLMPTQPAYAAEDPPEALELAEPVLDTPRILDAPEPEPGQMDLLQSFGDIQLEADERNDIDELPPTPAPLQVRFFAGLVDVLALIAGSMVFAAVFLALSSGLPPARLMLPAAAASVALLWLLYQYLFLVYSTGTPGMRMAALELHTFQGEPASLALRRKRAFAALLSACSLGLGYFWAYVDEDTLCWHDRITGTCVREQDL